MKEGGVGGKKTTTGLRFERCAYKEGYSRKPKAMKAKSKAKPEGAGCDQAHVGQLLICIRIIGR